MMLNNKNVVGKGRCSVFTDYINKISYIGTLFIVRFIPEWEVELYIQVKTVCIFH
jgi:hypothetical protein